MDKHVIRSLLLKNLNRTTHVSRKYYGQILDTCAIKTLLLLLLLLYFKTKKETDKIIQYKKYIKIV